MTDYLFSNEGPVSAAMHYAALALLQRTRPDVLAVLDGPPDLQSSWPPGLTWEPAPTPRENLQKARLLIDLELAEPGTEPVDTDYPPQHEVADWVERNFGRDRLDITTLGLVEEVGELCRAILKREQGVRGSFDEWTAEIRKELGDVMIKLLDVADKAGFDLATVTTLRWRTVSQRDFRADPRGHGLPADESGAA